MMPGVRSGQEEREDVVYIIMKINKLSILILVFILNISGCSSTWYGMMENGRIDACESLHGQEREECLEEATIPYERYERERAEALGYQ
ncbi:hypothetical protein H206_01277 [Candidatus Electrothrix aarhusensis]|uniref:Uncharacterized protein n=1 Tax=Candidatus Electrothrix aarhusensis TaxID=1859131 RepID=A0A3S3QHT5_9BACT|nr:hypothetical protein H206_01277 [Candidatus Electrothrix aarhusensis]